MDTAACVSLCSYAIHTAGFEEDDFLLGFAEHVFYLSLIHILGAQLVKEVATKTNDVAGDGTTTATVLAQAMVQTQLSAWKKRERSMPEPLRQDGVPCNRQVWQNCRLKRSSLMW